MSTISRAFRRPWSVGGRRPRALRPSGALHLEPRLRLLRRQPLPRPLRGKTPRPPSRRPVHPPPQRRPRHRPLRHPRPRRLGRRRRRPSRSRPPSPRPRQPLRHSPRLTRRRVHRPTRFSRRSRRRSEAPSTSNSGDPRVATSRARVRCDHRRGPPGLANSSSSVWLLGTRRRLCAPMGSDPRCVVDLGATTSTRVAFTSGCAVCVGRMRCHVAMRRRP